jgi:hypothetical protein
MRPLVIVAVTAAAFVFAGLASPHAGRHRVAAAPAFKCGVERWPVKTLADPDAPHISKRAVSRTVDSLARLDVVIGIGGARGVGVELKRVKVKAKLVGIKTEPDGDFHLVIKDPETGMKMIVEFPNSGCTHGAPAALRKKMQAARVAVVDACGFTPNSGYHHVNGDVTVTGVPFFDFIHRQTGHAPNGIELHPVLRFTGHCTG